MLFLYTVNQRQFDRLVTTALPAQEYMFNTPTPRMQPTRVDLTLLPSYDHKDANKNRSFVRQEECFSTPEIQYDLSKFIKA